MIFNQYFYHPDLSQSMATLSMEESEHCVRALRHHTGDEIQLTDGKGRMARASITDDNPKKCSVEILEVRETNDRKERRLHLAIAPTKNMDRIEWLVEKTVEIGIESISFIICDHSERPRVNLDRLHRIAVSALKQCQTSWLPPMEMVSFDEFIRQNNYPALKFIAWCDDFNTRQFADEILKTKNDETKDILLLIGPEGDFSPREIEAARQNNYTEVKLGNRRLRTETAGFYGCMTIAVSEEISPLK